MKTIILSKDTHIQAWLVEALKYIFKMGAPFK